MPRKQLIKVKQPLGKTFLMCKSNMVNFSCAKSILDHLGAQHTPCSPNLMKHPHSVITFRVTLNANTPSLGRRCLHQCPTTPSTSPPSLLPINLYLFQSYNQLISPSSKIVMYTITTSQSNK